MLGRQWRGCQASVIIARVSRKENVRALSSTSATDPRISLTQQKPLAKFHACETSKVSHGLQVIWNIDTKNISLIPKYNVKM